MSNKLTFLTYIEMSFILTGAWGHFILSVALSPYFCDLLPLNEPDSAAVLHDLHSED